MASQQFPYARFEERWTRRPGGWEVEEWRDGEIVSHVFVPEKRRTLARFLRWFWEDGRWLKKQGPA